MSFGTDLLLNIAGPAIGGIIGGFGAKASAKESARQMAANRAQAQAQFDSQMDESVQRRVADAQAAGIHPLFALGASVGASPTLIGGGQPTGSAKGDALQAIGAQLARVNLAGIKQANASASRDEAEAAYLNAQTKKLESDTNATGRDGAVTYGYGEKATDIISYGPEFIEELPRVPRMQKPGVRAGTEATHIEVQDASGGTYRVFNPDKFDDIMSPGFLDYARQRAGSNVARNIETAGYTLKNIARMTRNYRDRNTARNRRLYQKAVELTRWIDQQLKRVRIGD